MEMFWKSTYIGSLLELEVFAAEGGGMQSTEVLKICLLRVGHDFTH